MRFALSLFRSIAFFLALTSLGHAETSRSADFWERAAPRCNNYPSKPDCDDGDMALFSGLLCAAGINDGCNAVAASQGEDGRWWRSPRRNGDNVGEDNSFSRDMAIGVLLYLVTTHDSDRAQRWLSWIEDNRACVLSGPFNHCLQRGPYRYCTDDSDNRCSLTPSSWALMGRVWDHLGLDLSSAMREYRDDDSDALVESARRAPVGYATHLLGVEVLLKQLMNVTRAPREDAAQILIDRQPENPFFQFLSGASAGDVEERINSLCPTIDEQLGESSQWAWERDTDEGAWHDAMLWDCLFLSRVIAMRY